MIHFEGQVAVVTGGGRGLGRLYAMEMARRGASVVVNDLGGDSRGTGADTDVAETVVAEIKAAGGNAVASTDSVGTEAGGKAIIEAALDNFGRVDAVINNAGIIRFTPFEDIDGEEWRQMLNVHLDGAFNVSRPAFRAMKRQGYGRFVNISSSAGMFGYPTNAHYGTAKAGLVGLTNVLALEGAAHGILANAILPTGHSRMVTDNVGDAEPTPEQAAFYASMRPELIMPIVVYLASSECRVSHHNYAAFAGRYSRVFIGYGKGWTAPDGTSPGVEDIDAHFEEIGGTEDFTILGSLYDELVEVMGARGVKF